MKMYKKQMPEAASNNGDPRKNPLIKCKGRIMDNWSSNNDEQMHRSMAGAGDNQFNDEKEKAMKTKTMVQPFNFSSFNSGRGISQKAQAPQTNNNNSSDGSS